LAPPPEKSVRTDLVLLLAETPALLDAKPDAPPPPPLAFLLALRLDAATMMNDDGDAKS
jgi:hypothetical protein